MIEKGGREYPSCMDIYGIMEDKQNNQESLYRIILIFYRFILFFSLIIRIFVGDKIVIIQQRLEFNQTNYLTLKNNMQV